MKNHIFHQQLKRIFCQVQFRPTLAWLDNRVTVAKMFEEDYEDWQTKDGNISLYSEDQRKALEILTNQINYINETDMATDESEKQIDTVMNKQINEYKIKQIRRIGFRKTEVLSSSFHFSELVQHIYTKFYSNQKEIEELQTGKVHDLSYVVDTQDKDVTTHVQIGAMKKTEGENFFSKATIFSEKQTVDSETNLYIDIHVSTDNVTMNNVSEKLKQIIKINMNTYAGYLQFLSK